jgi:Fanconi anemia group M protein
VKGYSYVKLARYYMLQASNPLILGLTASPGGCFKRIEEIRKNLFIEAVEVRSEKDEDVKPYIMPVRQEWVYVELPKDFRRVRDLLDECLKENLSWLEQRGLLRSIKASRKDLLGLQDRLIERYRSEPRAPTWHALRRTIEAVKLEHAIELLETQSIPSLLEYMQKLSESEKRIDRDLMRDPRIRTALSLARTLSQTKSHPKLDRLGYIIKDLLRGNARARIMVFANYRSTVDLIKGCLEGQGISSRILIGQALRGGRGLSQREQVSVLEQFNRGDFNVLVASSIGEEGLSIADVNAVIFYDSVASEIRKIQRRGRTGRTAPGKVVFLITKGTRDEAYYWAALHRERKMKGILYRMRKRLRKERSLVQWVKGG